MTAKITRRDVMVGAAASAGALIISSSNGFAASPKNHVVKITSFEFVPQNVVVSVGDTISWINEDLAPHTATADEGGWDTGEMAKNDTKSITVTSGMETSYFCAYHPHMKGKIELK
jgi:plastocyanin